MEVLKKNIHMYRQTKRAVNQITLEEDFNVPDVKQDVEQIIQNKANVVVEHTRTEQERLLVKGYVQVSVLYMDDTEGRQIHRLDNRLKFDEVINMEGVTAGESVDLKCEIEDINVIMINSRKLSMRGLLTFTAAADEVYDMNAAVDVKSDLTVCKKQQKLEYMQLELQKKDIIRIKEEILLPSNKPDMEEILWETVQLRSNEIRMQDGKMKVEGELFVFVLYNSQDENGTKQWLEQTLPIKGEVEIPDTEAELLPDVEVQLGQIEVMIGQDTDGESRVIQVEGVMELDMRLYTNRELELLQDIFSPEKELDIFNREEVYESMVMRNASRMRVNGRVHVEGRNPGILQICNSQAAITVDDVRITELGIELEGAVTVQMLYISADDAMPFAVLTGSIPFTHFADIPGLDENCRYRLSTSLEQLSTTMADSEEIEVRAAVSMNLFVVRTHTQKCIADIVEKELDLKKVQQLPGIVGYIVQEGDTLWDIARTYYTTPERIMEMNQMEKKTVQKGDRLILMKELEKVKC